MNGSPARTRSLVFMVSGLIDCLLGVFLLFSWLEILPFDMSGFGLSPGWVGLLGAILSISGVIVVVYQFTRLKEPDE